jgi:hypothetical protein
VAERKPPAEEETAEPEGDVIPMPVSDVAVWDDEARLKTSPPTDWPYSGMSEEEAIEAAKKLPKPKGE